MSDTGSRVAAVVVAAGAALAVSFAPASAQTATCDAYSGACPPPTQVLPSTVSSPPPVTAVRGATTRTAESPSVLPFTGGELVLVSLAGAGALAAGGALLVAGRRRAVSPRPDEA